MLSIPHLIIILVVALVVFGPEKLPELARNVGKFMVEFRRITGGFKGSLDGYLGELEREGNARRSLHLVPRLAGNPSFEAVSEAPANGSSGLTMEAIYHPEPVTDGEHPTR